MSKKQNNIKKPLAVLACGVLATSIFGLIGCADNDKSSGKIYRGTDYSVASKAENGDFFIDTDDYRLYQKVDGSWILIKENFDNGEVTITGYNFINNQTVYLLNETFNLTNTKLRLFMSDNTYQDVTINSNMIALSPDMTVAGTKTIKVMYEGNEYKYEIEVQDCYTPTTSFAMSTLSKAKVKLNTSSNFKLETSSGDVEETYILDNDKIFIKKSNGVDNLKSTWLVQGSENVEKYDIENNNYTYTSKDTTLTSQSPQEFINHNTSDVLADNVEESKIESVKYSNGLLHVYYKNSATETIEYIIENGNIILIIKDGEYYKYSYDKDSLNVPEIPVATWNLSDEEAKNYLREAIEKSTSQNKVSYKTTNTETATKSGEAWYSNSTNGSVICDQVQNIAYLNSTTETSWNILQNLETKNVLQYKVSDGKYYKSEIQPLGSTDSFAQAYMPDPLNFNDWTLTNYDGTFTNNELNSISISFDYSFNKDFVYYWTSDIVTYTIENGLITKCEELRYSNSYSKSWIDGEMETEFTYKTVTKIDTTEMCYNESSEEIPALNTNLFPELTAKQYLSTALNNIKTTNKIKVELTESNGETAGTILMHASENIMYSTSNNKSVNEEWTIKEDDAWVSYWINTSETEPSYHTYRTETDGEDVTIYDNLLSFDGLNITLHLNDEHLAESFACYKINEALYLTTGSGWVITIEDGWIVSATDRLQTIHFTYDDNVTETIPTLPDHDWQ